jgi:hypothetical protein
LGAAECKISRLVFEHLAGKMPGKNFVFSPHAIMKGVAALLAAHPEQAARDNALKALDYEGNFDDLRKEILAIESAYEQLHELGKRPESGFDQTGPRSWFRYRAPALFWLEDEGTDLLRSRTNELRVEVRTWPETSSPDNVLNRTRAWLSKQSGDALRDVAMRFERRERSLISALHLVAPWGIVGAEIETLRFERPGTSQRNVKGLVLNEGGGYDRGRWVRGSGLEGPAFDLEHPHVLDEPSTLPETALFIAFFASPPAAGPAIGCMNSLEYHDSDLVSAHVPEFRLRTTVDVSGVVDALLQSALPEAERGNQRQDQRPALFFSAAALGLGQNGINGAPKLPPPSTNLMDVSGAPPRHFSMDRPHNVVVWDAFLGAVFYVGYVAEVK